MLAQLLNLPVGIDVVFFGGNGAHLLLHALHVTLAEFEDAGYVVMMSDSAALQVHRVVLHIESLGISSCTRALSFRPHILSSAILNDPIFTQSNQSSLSPIAFSSLDDGFMITRAAAELMLAERRRWLQVRSVSRKYGASRHHTPLIRTNPAHLWMQPVHAQDAGNFCAEQVFDNECV